MAVIDKVAQFFDAMSITFITDRNIVAGKENKPGDMVFFDNIFYFSDSLPLRRKNDITLLTGVETVVSYCCSPIVGPFYLAMISGHGNGHALTRLADVLGISFENFVKKALGECPKVEISSEMDTSKYRLPPEAINAEGIAAQYSENAEKGPIVYFERTFTRMGNNFSFTIGIDTNRAVARSNMELIEAVEETYRQTSSGFISP